jgi:enediyne biosynthesis protein E4
LNPLVFEVSVRNVHNILIPILILFVGHLAAQQNETKIRLDDATNQSNIGFVHSDGSSGRRYVVEPFTAGLAIFDYDGDGYLDIYFLNGSALPGSKFEKPLQSALYRNNGNWTFTDVSATSGTNASSYALGVVAGDYDSDGDVDLYVTNFGPNTFFENNGDGTFADRTAEAGLGGGEKFSAGVAMLDIEGDGDLDIYCANYQQFDFSQHKIRMIGSYQFHPGPLDYPPAKPMLFRNEGDGTFADISQQSGVSQYAAPGMGVIAGDFDSDGDSDIFVANDNYPNFLFINDGRGNFAEQAALRGVAVDRNGRANGNMGVEWADFDGDGLLDFFTTTYQDEMPVLYRHVGDGYFEDATNLAKVDHGLLPHVTWGVGAVDFDNDADKDIFITTGHFMDNIQYITDRTSMKVANFLLENNGKGRFLNVTKQAGAGLQIIECSRGSGHDDLDNDGKLDVVVANFNAAPSLLRNSTVTDNHWIELRLVGRTMNREAIGARVTVDASGMRQTQFVHAGRGYQSHYGTRLHFGLGQHRGPIQIQIEWQKNSVQDFEIRQVDQEVCLIERR